MVGFEIWVNVSRDKRQEFLQTCDMLGAPGQRNPDCLRQALFENVWKNPYTPRHGLPW